MYRLISSRMMISRVSLKAPQWRCIIRRMLKCSHLDAAYTCQQGQLSQVGCALRMMSLLARHLAATGRIPSELLASSDGCRYGLSSVWDGMKDSMINCGGLSVSHLQQYSKDQCLYGQHSVHCHVK
jgi:hypothetical protein